MAESTDHDAGSVAKHDFPPPPATYTLRLVSIRSYLVISQRRVSSRSGTLEELTAFARQVRLRNLLLGWWGVPFGLVWTPVALNANRKALHKLHELVSSGASPARWLPDPSGRHGARYWDGSKWTDRVSDVSVDELPEEASTG